MQLRRVRAMAGRVITQIRRDHRSVGLLLVVPMIVMGLLGYILRLDPGPLRLAMVVEDGGAALPGGQRLAVAELLRSALEQVDDLELNELDSQQAESRLREGDLDAVVVLPEGLSQALIQGEAAQIEIVVEGSNPAKSENLPVQISAQFSRALQEFRLAAQPPELELETRYLYASADFDFLDSFAPVYIAFFAYFFVFMLTGVSFLRERTQGTMERLLATPIARLEIALGYMLGFGVFALLQSTVFLFFTILVVKIQYVGNLALVFVLLALVAVGAVNLGIFLSTYARTELQVIQFIPIVIIPQALLSGIIFPVDQLPSLLRGFAHIMPLTYANRAMIDVMIRGFGLQEVAWDLTLLLGFAVLALALSATTLRRQFI